MTDLKALAATVQPHFRFEELRELPILYVLDKAGIAYEEKTDGVYTAANPFRADEHPSFDVFGENLERWGDFAEGTSGDVVDLIARFIEHHTGVQCSVIEAKDEAARLLIEYRASAWDGPTTGGTRKTFNLEEARASIEEHLGGDPRITEMAIYGWQQLRTDSLRDIDTQWLVEKFHLAFDGFKILIPYFDPSHGLFALKTRIPGQPVYSEGGTSFPWFYGQWLDDGTSTVVLCEGESDVWSGTHAAPAGHVVLGLPTGAGSEPRQAHLLAGRRVILAFDGDSSGRTATRKWAAALHEVEAEVLIAYVPDDHDLSQLSLDDQRLTLASALPDRPAPPEVPTEMPGGLGYERQGKNFTSQISDWVYHPDQVLVGDDGVSWDGVMFPVGKRVKLRSSDLSSKPNIVRWAQQNGGTWLGSDRDAQLLAALYHAQSTYLPRGTSVSYTGLHSSVLVHPTGRLGQSNYVYVPGKIDIPLGSLVHIDQSVDQPCPYELPLRLRELHTTAVMDPILAWLAIAPLRSKLEQFPILAVTGGSGTGKTTLVRETVRHFTATAISANLTGTTKFAMLGYLGSTNAFPVWFDEYRPGARKETLAEFNQLLRDAYTGQSSIKGGMGESWATVREVAVRAPIIVSGEDSFSETSHTERMVLVHLPRNGKNTDLMKAVIEAGITGFAATYYDWIRTAEAPVVVPEGPEDLPDRQRHNLGVLRAGWNLLDAFLSEHGVHIDMPEPDWSLIIAEGTESASSNPILDAIRWALEEPRLQETRAVVDYNGRIHVRVESFVAEVTRSGTFTLPGGPLAVKKYLMSHLNGVVDRMNVSRLGVATDFRTVSVPRELIVSAG